MRKSQWRDAFRLIWRCRTISTSVSPSASEETTRRNIEQLKAMRRERRLRRGDRGRCQCRGEILGSAALIGSSHRAAVDGKPVVGPDLVVAEVVNTLLGLARTGKVDAKRAFDAVEFAPRWFEELVRRATCIGKLIGLPMRSGIRSMTASIWRLPWRGIASW